MESAENQNHYDTLGLSRNCTLAQIRAAYRRLAKRHHPDLNPDSPEAIRQIQALNAAHETLSDPARRRAYDCELYDDGDTAAPRSTGKIERNISQDAQLRLEDFLNGATLEVRVNDPANPHGDEVYQIIVPPETAPGTTFRLPRAEPFAGGHVRIRVRALPDYRFKVRGSDLRCDLKIRSERAAEGGSEMIRGLDGTMLSVQIPPGAARGEIVKLRGQGLPKSRGGRGDLLVRLTYRIKVQISRAQK